MNDQLILLGDDTPAPQRRSSGARRTQVNHTGVAAARAALRAAAQRAAARDAERRRARTAALVARASHPTLPAHPAPRRAA